MQSNASDDLTRDLLTVASGAVVKIPEAARLAVCSESKIRRAIWTGELTGSRRASNGPIAIRDRELARWLVDGEKNSLPAPFIDPDSLAVPR